MSLKLLYHGEYFRHECLFEESKFRKVWRVRRDTYEGEDKGKLNNDSTSSMSFVAAWPQAI